MGKRTTTIYVSTESENGKASFDVLTHAGGSEELEEGVFLAFQGESKACTIVASKYATHYTSLLNSAPGCEVTGTEKHSSYQP